MTNKPRKPMAGDTRLSARGMFKRHLVLQHYVQWDDDGMTMGKWVDTKVEDLNWVHWLRGDRPPVVDLPNPFLDGMVD